MKINYGSGNKESMGLKNMDILDEKIVETLLSQGYKNAAALSTQLGIGERTIRRRLNSLLNTQTIKVIIHTNPILLGYKCWARIGLNIEPGFSREVSDYLSQYKQVYFIGESVGTFDMILAVRFKDDNELSNFVNIELPKLQGIRGKEVFYLIWPAKYYNFQWPIRRDDHNSSGKTSENSGGNGYFELDEVDKQILEILTENALNKPPEMSARLDVSEGKIRKHLKKMSDHGLFKMDVLYTPGRDVSATIGIALHRCSVSNVMEYIVTQFPRVLMATFCIGRFNIILTASFRDNDALNEFVNVNLKSIKGVTSIETFIHTKRIKYHVS